ncbi:peptidase M28 [Chthoniobacter flavus Ellin428]|uniref:Peptidase M28 n=1 Tax=Chthoniobacter flavus Ellin428 TaxID=497964 RepID=B4CY06_9BACT|nr:M28 family peptidase [Chthoniobacter flavus]EDY21154.1 peptidase M28 [Chthoniobacter flavus Ellin428]TCO87526.1 WD40 repeat protein [Chthoniobacter flavus]
MRRLLLLFVCLFTVAAFADDAANEARFITNSRQLIFEGKRSGEGYFHPDGNLMIFQSEREEGNPFYQMYLLDLLSGETARVSTGVGKTTCGFFQPGTNRVLFASTHADPEALAKQKAELDFRASGKQRRYSWDYDQTMDIYSCNQDGTQMVNLTNSPGYDAEGSFSPDGKQIVFCSLRAAFPLEKLTPEQRARYEKDPAYFGDIYLMNADGSNVRRLTDAPGYDGGPFFSPDGARIIWRHFDESGMFADVWTMKLDGSDKHRVTDFKSMSWAPFYHPSGKYIIFTSNKLGFTNFELYIVDVNGDHEPVRVTYTDGFDGLPVFSPNGKKISWTSGRTSDGKSQIFLADWNHEAALKAIEESPLRGSSAAAATTEKNAQPSAPAKEAAATVQVDMKELSPEIRAEDLKYEDSWLADPAREGRETGTPGARASADFLTGYFRNLGLKPFGDDFREPFEFNSGARVEASKTSLSITEGKDTATYALEKDFRPLAFSENGSVDGEIVFAGYGLSVPEDAKNSRYNSYDNLDVKDKIVLFFRYVPEGVEAPRRAQLNRYSGLRYKAMMARERGAKAVLVVTGPNSPGAGELVPLTDDGSHTGSGILAASISSKVADALLAPSGKSLKDLQTGLDTENPHAEGSLVLPKVRVSLSIGVEHLKGTDRNVVACLPPTGGSDEYIVVGAHYDHLGHGGKGSSMAHAGEEGKVHPGADDNASGTAVVMELAASLAAPGGPKPSSDATKRRRGVIFALWSGEEIGLIGSAAFIQHPPVPLDKIAAYVNFDMVGRLRDNKLTMQGVGSSRIWRKELEKRNVAAGFSLVLQDDPYLPTDTTSFYPKHVPVLNFFTGAHEDYHRPTDTPDKLNIEGMERIAKFARQIVSDLATVPERPDYAHVQRSEQQSGSRDSLRAYLGTIPDYASEVKGVKLSGVRGDSPAEKGGIQGGDIIVEFAGQKIANIYDYTYALDAVKIGTPVKMIVERNGQRVELTVTPGSRK